MERPKNVHPDAEWRRNAKQWKYVERDEDENVKKIMAWSQDGVLRIDVTKDQVSDTSITKRFHPNGELAAEFKCSFLGLYNKGDYEKTFRAKSVTDEVFPAWDMFVTRVEALYTDRYKKDTHYYNLSGERLSLPEGLEKERKAFEEKYYDFENMSFEDQIQKLNNFIDQVIEIHPEMQGDLEKFSRPTFFSKVEKTDILEAEKRLGVQLPESYKTFLLQNGLFKIGAESGYKGRFVHPRDLRTVEQILRDDWLVDLSKYEGLKDKVSKHIFVCFSNNALEEFWGCTLDYTTLNPETQNVMASFFRPHNPNELNIDPQPAQKDGFAAIFKFIIKSEYQRIIEQELRYLPDFVKGV